jgi:hypothetical protein
VDAKVPHIGQRVAPPAGFRVSLQFMRKRGGVIMSPRHALGHLTYPFQLFYQD